MHRINDIFNVQIYYFLKIVFNHGFKPSVRIEKHMPMLKALPDLSHALCMILKIILNALQELMGIAIDGIKWVEYLKPKCPANEFQCAQWSCHRIMPVE